MTQTRRELLGAALASGLVLAGCGGDDPKLGTQTRALARRSVAIDYSSYYAPIEDVRRLVAARAQAVGAEVTLSHDEAGTAAQVANLKAWTGKRGGFRAVAVAPFDRAAVEPLAAAAIERGIAIVSYVTELEHQSAAITVDRTRAGTLLARHARERGAPDGVLLVRPPSRPAVPDPFASGFADAEAAIREQLDVVAVLEAQARTDAAAAVRQALDATPSRVVLAWNDQAALGAADALGDRGYAGGLGAPSLSGPEALRVLRGGGPLQCLVAARLGDLANALVDVPFALAAGKRTAGRAVVPVQLLGHRSPAAEAFLSDFR